MASKTKPTTTTKSKRSTTRAASTTPKAASKTATKAKVISTKTTPSVVDVDGTEVADLTKKEMVERMVASSGMKKGEARRAFEATMVVLAQALREGRNMSLPPLGKIKIARTKDTPNGKMVVMRAKLKDPEASPPKEPLAEAAE